jgi:hypothetical protein
MPGFECLMSRMLLPPVTGGDVSTIGNNSKHLGRTAVPAALYTAAVFTAAALYSQIHMFNTTYQSSSLT